MSDIACQTIAVDVGRPFEFGGVGVAGADVAGLELLELLLRAEFVGLERGVRVDSCCGLGRCEDRERLTMMGY